MKHLARITIVAWLALSSGCSWNRQARTQTAESVAASHAATIDKSLDGLQIPPVTVSGSSNVVTIAPLQVRARTTIDDSAATKGDASGDTRTTFHASFSTWLAIAACAVAVAALLFAWVFWSKASATGAAADQAFSTVITAAEHGATDLRALLEKQRGKVNSRL